VEIINFIADVVSGPENWLLVGLAAYLGKIWATRISQSEQAEIKEGLLRLRTKLDTEKESVDRTIQNQNDLVKQALQNASGERSHLFQKQYEIMSELWCYHLAIKKECGKFFIYHQIFTSAEKAKPSTFTSSKVARLTNESINNSLKAVMEIQAKAEAMQPMVPPSIFSLFSGLTTFYARLGLNHQFAVGTCAVPPWFLDKKNPDYSVKQLLAVADEIKLKLPELNDDLPGFDAWKGAFEARLLLDIQRFLNGSLERQLEMHNQIRSVTDENFSRGDGVE
jgi:hypothetical protein